MIARKQKDLKNAFLNDLKNYDASELNPSSQILHKIAFSDC